MSNTMRPRVKVTVPLVYDRGKGKKNLIKKTWERCKSIGRGNQTNPSKTPPRGLTEKSKSWPGSLTATSPENDKWYKRKQRITPDGCFSVYVGVEKERFIVKTENANHPLFRLLLEEAESEYGFHRGGPIELPCSVDTFYRVLAEMDDDCDRETRHSCSNFSLASPASYRLLSPSHKLIMNH